MIYVFFADGFEELEALAPVDVLRRKKIEVCMVGVGSLTITGAHGITIQCERLAEDINLSDAQMIILPGGMPGVLNLSADAAVNRAIDYAVENDLYIAAICAAPSILGQKGLLNGRKAVCYPSFEDQLNGAEVLTDGVCVDGKIITARGAGVALDFALKLLEILTSEQDAKQMRASLICKV